MRSIVFIIFVSRMNHIFKNLFYSFQIQGVTSKRREIKANKIQNPERKRYELDDILQKTENWLFYNFFEKILFGGRMFKRSFGFHS